MLYLLEAPARLLWIDIPESVVDIAAKNDADLARLQWRDDTSRKVTEDVIRVALRHGSACSRGLVLSAMNLIDLDRPESIRQPLRESKELRAKLAGQDEFMEQLIPGWKEHGRQLDARVDDSMDKAIQEAEDEAEALLAAPVDEALLAHWESLGGMLPEPF